MQTDTMKKQIFDEWQLKEQPINHPIPDLIIFNDAFVQNYIAQLFKRLQKLPESKKQLEKLTREPKHIVQLYEHLVWGNIKEFFNLVNQMKLSTHAINREEKIENIDKIINKYNGFFKLLSGTSQRKRQLQFLYAAANNLFYFCFDPKTCKLFRKFLKTPNLNPLARLCYAVMWQTLSSKGWLSWHQDTLTALQHHAQQKKEIVYLAGGTDIFQLLNHGIYSIRIIDPFLPTQNTYYSDGWKFLVGCGKKDMVGDVYTIKTQCGILKLKRADYTILGSFTATLSGKKVRRLPQSITQWRVFKEGSSKSCGTITIERRFVTQKDFSVKQTKTLLMSYNELYFITTAQDCSWGINVDQFNPAFTLHIKQLKRPLNRMILANMHKADKLPLDFIQLGACID